MSAHDDLTARISEAMREMIANAVLTNDRIARGYGIDVVELQTLGVIMRATSLLTPSQIAERTGQPTSTTTRVLDRLETAGFVKRIADAQNRRRIFIKPEPERLRAGVTEDPYAGMLEQLCLLHENFTPEELTVVARYLEAVAPPAD